MDNQGNKDAIKKYENNIPPQLDSEMTWLVWKQRYALFLVLFLGVSIVFGIKRPDFIYIIVIVYSTLAFLLMQANEYYTIAYAFYRYFMSIFVEPIEYYKEKERDTDVKISRIKKKPGSKKRTKKKTKSII